MAERNDYDRTEAPTQRRREESRQKGQVARSSDLTAACTLLGAVLLLYFAGERLWTGMAVLVRQSLAVSEGSNPTRADMLSADLAFSAKLMAESISPIAVGIAVVALAATVGQVGFLLTAKPLKPDFARLSPLRGVKNLIGMRAGVRLGMSVGKIAIIISLAAFIIAQEMPRILGLAELETTAMFKTSVGLVFSLAVKLALLLVLLAVLDYAYQRWQHERDLMMTKQEVKEELKRMEGDPLIRQRRTRVARQLALQRIGHAVPKADVVVTNPTHYAIALRYESGRMKAPKVVAKGADYLAIRIRQLAAAHDVPLVERRELAQAMYRSVEVGQEVPPQFYNAVAEILAYVYRLKGKQAA